MNRSGGTGDQRWIQNLNLVTGDYNRDGRVDEDDYSLWRSTYGRTGFQYADGNGDWVVDGADYSIWRDHFGLAVNERDADLSGVADDLDGPSGVESPAALLDASPQAAAAMEEFEAEPEPAIAVEKAVLPVAFERLRSKHSTAALNPKAPDPSEARDRAFKLLIAIPTTSQLLSSATVARPLKKRSEELDADANVPEAVRDDVFREFCGGQIDR